jgi:Mg2+ and Co2+ transporter CorA
MNIIKKIALTFFMAISLGAISTITFAEEAVNSSAASINETIAHIEKALVEVNKSDFSAAHLHLKAARASSEHITGNEVIVKQANASVIQGQIQSKYGDVKKSSDELKKAIELYKSLLK